MKKTLIITILLVSSFNCKKNQTTEIKEKFQDFPPKEMVIHANGGLRLRETPSYRYASAQGLARPAANSPSGIRLAYASYMPVPNVPTGLRVGELR